MKYEEHSIGYYWSKYKIGSKYDWKKLKSRTAWLHSKTICSASSIYKHYVLAVNANNFKWTRHQGQVTLIQGLCLMSKCRRAVQCFRKTESSSRVLCRLFQVRSSWSKCDIDCNSHTIKLQSQVVTDCYWLPWYNHNGWLGVKHQVTYLLTHHWLELDSSWATKLTHSVTYIKWSMWTARQNYGQTHPIWNARLSMFSACSKVCLHCPCWICIKYKLY